MRKQYGNHKHRGKPVTIELQRHRATTRIDCSFHKMAAPLPSTSSSPLLMSEPNPDWVKGMLGPPLLWRSTSPSHKTLAELRIDHLPCASLNNRRCKTPKHDTEQSTGLPIESQAYGSQPIKVRKTCQREGSSELHFQLRLGGVAKSAPTTAFSSPVRSPRRLSSVEFPLIATVEGTQGHDIGRTSSVPLVGQTLMVGMLAPPSNKGRVSPERSSLRSPRMRSPGPRSRIQNGALSPLHPKFASDFSAGWHDDIGNVSVHPLPLPPGSPNVFASVPLSSPSPSAGVHRSPGRIETSVAPGQWQKGKRLGSGTFGTVYEGFNRETGDMCAMKEVPLIPDDSQSCESIKQLGQVSFYP
eukprot:Gb_12067 [translate_table: standard]